MIRSWGLLPDSEPRAARPLGWFRSSDAVDLPASLDRRDLIDDIRDQAWTSACAAFALSRAIELHGKLRYSRTFEPPSEIHLYQGARASDGDQPLVSDNGTSFGAIADAVHTVGYIPAHLAPWDPNKINERLDWGVFASGIDQHSISTHPIATTGKQRCVEIVSSLVRGCGVYLALQATQSLCDLRAGLPWDGAGEVMGGHAVCALDYDANNLRCIGSWGPNYCDEGLFLVPWRLVEQGISVKTPWAIECAPNYSL